MNKRLIARLMKQQVNGLQHSGVYFFRGAFEHVLRGVVLEYVPRGLYIWDFRFPLFDLFGPNLNYSDRLSKGAFIGKGSMSEQAIVDYVLASSEAKDALGSEEPIQLLAFVQYLLESNALLSPHVQLIYVVALILLGEQDRAAAMLDNPPPDLHPTDVPEWNLLRQNLQQDNDVLKTHFEHVRQKNLRAFGLI